MSDARKAPLDLVPLRALVGAARVLAHGNTKRKPDGTPRAPGDFIERPLDGVFFASYLRHTMELQLLNGTVTPASMAVRDVDTDLPTIDHAICNLLIIRTMLVRDGLLPEDPGAGRSSPIRYPTEPEPLAPCEPPAAPNCRCIAEPLLDGNESPETKAAVADFFRAAETYGVERDPKGPWEPPCTVENPCPSCRYEDERRNNP